MTKKSMAADEPPSYHDTIQTRMMPTEKQQTILFVTAPHTEMQSQVIHVTYPHRLTEYQIIRVYIAHLQSLNMSKLRPSDSSTSSYSAKLRWPLECIYPKRNDGHSGGGGRRDNDQEIMPHVFAYISKPYRLPTPKVHPSYRGIVAEGTPTRTRGSYATREAPEKGDDVDLEDAFDLLRLG